MKANKRSARLPQLFALAGFASSSLTGCLSQAELDAMNGAFGMGADAPSAVMPPNVEPSCFNERFVQPQAEISRSIDILFVMDTSGSMDNNRAKVADGLSSFVAELPPEVDYQVGVMLAHGSRSAWSGKLFNYQNNMIFSSSTMAIGTIQSSLRSMVLNTPRDSSGEQGEEGMYSLFKGLTNNFQVNQQAGFFRPHAALAVIFVSDENDLCAPYAGLTTTPGLTSAEKTIRNRDCRGGIPVDQIISKVKEVQGERPFLFGAVTHQQLNYSDSAGNDSYGYGIMEIIQATSGVSTEINDGSYTQGLSNMGKLATTKLNLLVDFTLAHPDVDPASITTYVDGAQIDFAFDSAQNDVHLSSGGGAQSVIDINYCISETPAPVPTPTPTFTIPVS